MKTFLFLLLAGLSMAAGGLYVLSTTSNPEVALDPTFWKVSVQEWRTVLRGVQSAVGQEQTIFMGIAIVFVGGLSVVLSIVWLTFLALITLVKKLMERVEERRDRLDSPRVVFEKPLTEARKNQRTKTSVATFADEDIDAEATSDKPKRSLWGGVKKEKAVSPIDVAVQKNKVLKEKKPSRIKEELNIILENIMVRFGFKEPEFQKKGSKINFDNDIRTGADKIIFDITALYKDIQTNNGTKHDLVMRARDLAPQITDRVEKNLLDKDPLDGPFIIKIVREWAKRVDLDTIETVQDLEEDPLVTARDRFMMALKSVNSETKMVDLPQRPPREFESNPLTETYGEQVVQPTTVTTTSPSASELFEAMTFDDEEKESVSSREMSDFESLVSVIREMRWLLKTAEDVQNGEEEWPEHMEDPEIQIHDAMNLDERVEELMFDKSPEDVVSALREAGEDDMVEWLETNLSIFDAGGCETALRRIQSGEQSSETDQSIPDFSTEMSPKVVSETEDDFENLSLPNSSEPSSGFPWEEDKSDEEDTSTTPVTSENTEQDDGQDEPSVDVKDDVHEEVDVSSSPWQDEEDHDEVSHRENESTSEKSVKPIENVDDETSSETQDEAVVSSFESDVTEREKSSEGGVSVQNNLVDETQSNVEDLADDEGETTGSKDMVSAETEGVESETIAERPEEDVPDATAPREEDEWSELGASLGTVEDVRPTSAPPVFEEALTHSDVQDLESTQDTSSFEQEPSAEVVSASEDDIKPVETEVDETPFASVQAEDVSPDLTEPMPSVSDDEAASKVEQNREDVVSQMKESLVEGPQVHEEFPDTEKEMVSVDGHETDSVQGASSSVDDVEPVQPREVSLDTMEEIALAGELPLSWSKNARVAGVTQGQIGKMIFNLNPDGIEVLGLMHVVLTWKDQGKKVHVLFKTLPEPVGTWNVLDSEQDQDLVFKDDMGNTATVSGGLLSHKEVKGGVVCIHVLGKGASSFENLPREIRQGIHLTDTVMSPDDILKMKGT